MKIHLEPLARANGWTQSVQCLFMERDAQKDPRGVRTMHYHEYIELLYGLLGQSEVWIGDHRFPLGPGDLAIVNAQEVHEVAIPAGQSRYFVIKFLPQLLYSQGQSIAGMRYLLPLWQKDMLFTPILPAGELRQIGVDVLLREIVEEFEQKRSGYELWIQANIMKAFVQILRRRCPQQPAAPAGITEKIQNRLYAAMQLAQVRFAEWTVRDAAEACELSYSYFSRLFKQMFGISFCTYLENVRLQESERLLLTGDRKISDIAADVGFCSTSHFIESFRRRYGVTPHAFRCRICRT